MTLNSFAVESRYYINAYVTHLTGAAGGDDKNMNPNGDAIFAYTVPANTELHVARLNLAIVDAKPNLTDFGGIINGLANGVLLDIVDRNGRSIFDLTAGRPLKQNADFLYVAGIDMDIVSGSTGAGLDVVKVRYSLFKAGANLKLKAGEQVRFTIRDDLSSIDQFRCMVQGIMSI